MNPHPARKTSIEGKITLGMLREGMSLGSSVQASPTTIMPIAQSIRPIRLIHMTTSGNGIIVSTAIVQKPMKMSAIPPKTMKFLIGLFTSVFL